MLQVGAHTQTSPAVHRARSQATPSNIDASLERLAEQGLEAPDDNTAQRINGSLSAGYESLVRFGSDEEPVVASFHSPQDLESFAALMSGGGVSGELAAVHGSLQQVEGRGEELYLLRKKGDKPLPTNAAAAAIALARGESVKAVANDGTVTTLKNAAQAAELAAARPDTKSPQFQAGALIDAAEEAKLSVSAYQPPAEDVDPQDIGAALKDAASKFQGMGQRDLDQLSRMTGALAGGERVQVTLPDNGSELPMVATMMPHLLNQTQLQAAVTWQTSPTPEMKAFQADFDALTKGGALFMGRQPEGPMKGMLVRTDARSAYLNLMGKGEVVALKPDGDLQKLTEVGHLKQLRDTGEVPVEVTRFDPAAGSKNLVMGYLVSPFDPVEKGNYDALPLRLTEVGSSAAADVVVMRSDLPQKKNLRVDRIQKGDLEELRRLPAETSMSDPKVLEQFIYQTIKDHPDHQNIRLLVGGHGGAEKGLLPDGEHNDAAAHQAMPVDGFAGAIKKALDRVEEESGTRPRIKNLFLVSCLMGNSSFIQALAKTGDIDAVCASPEMMMGAAPVEIISSLKDPQFTDASGVDYARRLVDINAEAPAMPGGSKQLHHADTYGAYDLDPAKAQRFETALDGFFDACLAKPEYAGIIKEDIAKCPTYGGNPLLNVLMFDIDQRDIVQVARRIQGDARLPGEIKEACQELIDASLDQVIVQRVSDKYKGREGATIYLPVDRFDFDEKLSQTELLQGTGYKQFMEMLFDAPLQRSVGDRFLSEINRFTEMMRTEAEKAGASSEKEEAGDKKKAEGGANQQLLKMLEGVISGEGPAQVHALEERIDKPVAEVVGKPIRTLVRGLAAAAGGVVTGVIGGAVGVVAGGLIGARAGWTGRSLAGDRPAAKEPQFLSLAGQAMLYPAEGKAIGVHQNVGYRMGTFAGRVAGAVTGFVCGALGTGLVTAGLAALPGGLLGYGVGALATAWIPGAAPSKDHPAFEPKPPSAEQSATTA